jgi:predicted outer membrane repeat protein
MINGGYGSLPGSPTVANVTFSRNMAEYGGGMISWGSSNPTLVNVMFLENTALSDGGGMYNADDSGATLTNVVFWGNSAGQHGGGMFNANFLIEVTLTNVTFSRNVAAVRGGGIYNDTFSPTLTNVILWGDSATTSGDEIYNAGTAPLISHSLIEGSGGSGGGWDPALGTDGGNNLDADPLFVDAVGGNVRLSYGSPAADAGDNAAPNLPATDLDGEARIVDGTVDLGAYEFQGPTGVGLDDASRSFRIVSISPNPFNPSTTVHFRLPEAMLVTVEIFSVTGARVRVLASRLRFGPGDNRLLWDGRNDRGSSVASGMYFIRLRTLLGSSVARAVLLK